MIFIVTATRSEALPFTRFLGLGRNQRHSGIEVYEGVRFTIIVSGIGKVASATAVAAVLSQPGVPKNSVVVNIGCCGCSDTQVALESLFLVHKIVDRSNGSEYFPEILAAHPFKEAVLFTFDRPVASPGEFMPAELESGASPSTRRLADMEASGFYVAARKFVPSQSIFCLKLVSDHLNPERVSAQKVENGLKKHREIILDWLSGVEVSLRETNPEVRISSAEIEMIKKVTKTLRLTTTQKHQLNDWVAGYIIRHGKSPGFLNKYTLQAVKQKAEGKTALARIKDELLS